MEATFRVSVRELVGFTYFPPDIAPMAGVEEMLAGTKAHQRCEAAQAALFEIEKPLRADVPLMGEVVTVFGRMDAYADGQLPCVEEIKLCRVPPDVPLPEHLAQARLYGALLCLNAPIEAVDVRVAYVDEAGGLLRTFAAEEPRATLLSLLGQLLAPWLAFAIPERAHRQQRDASLRAMPFPFPSYRAGQRELAAQVYTAITRKKRLFVSLPTGTGKSAAVLFPALKALGEGRTKQLIYLTARTTARQSPLNTLAAMRAQGMRARVSTVTAKEKLCPAPTRCHPDDCPRAKGHFLRQPKAVQALLAMDTMWTDEVIAQVADAHLLCPFELALTLCDLADVVLLDMNYAFDPFAQIARIFKRRKDFTLLIDEAHHLLDRVRESLSGSLDTKTLREYRTLMGKALGRRHPYLQQVRALLDALRALDGGGAMPDAAQADTTALGITAGNAPVPGSAAAAVACSTLTQAPLRPAAQGDVSMKPVPLGTVQALGTQPPSAVDIPLPAGFALPPAAFNQRAGNRTPPLAQDGLPPAEAMPLFTADLPPPALPNAEAEAAARRTPRELTLPAPPPALTEAAEALLAATFALLSTHLPTAEARREAGQMIRRLAPFVYAVVHFDARYAALLTCHGRERALELYCLSPAEAIAAVTKGLRGTVFFSATLKPLPEMRGLLGGGAEDACFSLPSPFPVQNLAVVRRRVQTRYVYRQSSAQQVAQCIAEAACARAGRYIAYFPSYAYLQMIHAQLLTLPVPPMLVQESDMTEEARARFLEAFMGDDAPKLGLCVLGGLFSEGVDLPGEQLIGAIIVGVGLPTPSLRLRTLQAYYEARFGDGFLYAWMIPAMQKVSQAGGRVIRTETDKGLVLLLDDRYFNPRYVRLLPEHWAPGDGHIAEAVRALWGLEERG